MRHIPTEVWNSLSTEIRNTVNEAIEEWLKEQEPRKSIRPGISTEHVFDIKSLK